MIEYFLAQVGLFNLMLLFATALLIGIAKAGISGTALMAVPVLAIGFGGKVSTGLMLPILITADIFAVIYYHRHANWTHLSRLFPWAGAGVVVGTLVGDYVDDDLFRLIMGCIILISLSIMLIQQTNKSTPPPNNIWFTSVLGILSGITTMIGNLAGAFMSLYLLAMRLPKNVFIGTAAWFFLVVNVFKIPFHVFVWETISVDTLALDLVAIPAVFVGFLLGVVIVKKIPESIYRWVIIISTATASLVMVF